MKSLKSLFAVLSFVALSFACASVTETPVATATPEQPTTITITDDAAFAGGNDVKPILHKPKI